MKIFLAAILVMVLVSCSSSDSVEPTSESGVETYINTLETSVGEARNAADTISTQQIEIQQSIQEME